MQLVKDIVENTRKKIEQLKPTKYPVRTYTYRPNTRPWRRGDPEHTITVWGDKHNPYAQLITRSIQPLKNRLGIGAYGLNTMGSYIDSRCKVRFNDPQSDRKAA
jgi:hypothetical protein